jgi:hypothetical protein
MNYQEKYLKYKTKYLNLKAQSGGINIIEIISDNVKFEITTKILNDKKIYIVKDKDTKKTYTSVLIKDKICIIDEDIKTGNYYFYLMKINIDNGDILSPNDEFKDVQKQIEDILESTSDTDRIIFDIMRNVKNATVIRFYGIANGLSMDLSEAQIIIDELNIQLKRKCTNLEIKFDHMYKLTNSIVSFHEDYNILTLCLYNGDNCVSSIQLTHPVNNISNITISSKTSPDYEGRKYNKMLRAIIIIISKFIKYNGISEIIKTIYSSAVNPISAWLFINSFNAKTNDKIFNEFIKDKELSFDLVEEYFKKDPEITGLNTYIEVNDINIAKAIEIFNLLLDAEDQLKC